MGFFHTKVTIDNDEVGDIFNSYEENIICARKDAMLRLFGTKDLDQTIRDFAPRYTDTIRAIRNIVGNNSQEIAELRALIENQAEAINMLKEQNATLIKMMAELQKDKSKTTYTTRIR